MKWRISPEFRYQLVGLFSTRCRLLVYVDVFNWKFNFFLNFEPQKCRSIRRHLTDHRHLPVNNWGSVRLIWVSSFDLKFWTFFSALVGNVGILSSPPYPAYLIDHWEHMGHPERKHIKRNVDTGFSEQFHLFATYFYYSTYKKVSSEYSWQD